MYTKVTTIISLIWALFMIGLNEGQIGREALTKCRTGRLRPHPSLNFGRYLGTWHPLMYATGKAHQASRGSNLACLTVNLTQTVDANVFNYDEEWYFSLGNGLKSLPSRGQGKVSLRPESPFIWTVDHTPEGSIVKKTGDVVVLATSENAWAIEYHCAIQDNEIEERVVVLGRKRQVDSEPIKVMAAMMYALGMSRENVVVFEQRIC